MAINSSFNKPIPTPEPEPPFEEPDLKSLDDFITYCSIFDPTVSTQSGRVIDYYHLLYHDQIYRDTIIINLFNKFAEIGCVIQRIEDGVLFICDAPFYSEKPKEYSLKIVEDKLSKQPKVNTSWENLRRSQVHVVKTYAYFQGSVNHQMIRRWLILKAPTQKNVKYSKFPRDMMGYGNTLPEADLEFQKARLQTFTSSPKTINYFIDDKIPLTQQQMFNVCKKTDPLVDPNTVTFSYYGFSEIESSYFKMSCQSKTYKFTLDVRRGNARWEVVRIFKVKDNDYPVNLEFLGKGQTLEEALDMCESRYQKCINNPKQLDMMISSKQHEEMQKALMMDEREGEAFFNDLIAEYGEDILPDRD